MNVKDVGGLCFFPEIFERKPAHLHILFGGNYSTWRSMCVYSPLSLCMSIPEQSESSVAKNMHQFGDHWWQFQWDKIHIEIYAYILLLLLGRGGTEAIDRQTLVLVAKYDIVTKHCYAIKLDSYQYERFRPVLHD